MKKGILIIVDIKDDMMRIKYHKLISMIQALYYPPCERDIYPLEGEQLEKCLKHIT